RNAARGGRRGARDRRRGARFASHSPGGDGGPLPGEHDRPGHFRGGLASSARYGGDRKLGSRATSCARRPDALVARGVTVHVLRAAGTFLVLLSALHLCVAAAIACGIVWLRVRSSVRAKV